MKKLLTILVLALALCLVCSVAMADSVEISGTAWVNATQKAKDNINWTTRTANTFTLDHDLDAATPDLTFSIVAPGITGMKCEQIRTIKYSAVDASGVTVWFQFNVQAPHIDPDPVNHVVNHYDKVNPTCTKEGSQKYLCVYCHEKITESIPAKKHSWERDPATWVDGIYSKFTPPTCGEPGVYGRLCTDCGEIKPGSEQVIEEIAHEFVFVWDVEPTCMNVGKADYVCAYCGLDWLTYYNNGGYTATAWRHNNVYLPICGPTVTWTPYTASLEPKLAGIASEYGKKLSNNYMGHDFDAWTVVTPASCKTETIYERWCKVCGQKQQLSNTDRFGKSDKWAPSYALSSTVRDGACDKVVATFKCTKCGSSAAGHGAIVLKLQDKKTAKATNPTITDAQWAMIDMLPDVVQKIEAHEYLQKDAYKIGTIKPTCEGEGGVAYACAYEIDTLHKVIGTDIKIVNNEVTGAKHGYNLFDVKEALGHTWVGGGDGWVLYKAPKAEDNEYGVWTRTCSVCSKTENRVSPYYPDACETHTYEEIYTFPATCTEDGETYYICSRCGDEKLDVLPALDHDWDLTVKVAPTCKAAGEAVGICKRCGASQTGIELEKLEHKWDEGVITTEPTYEKEGVKTFTCTACGETKTETVAKKDKPAEYKLSDVKFEGGILSGKVTHTEGTLDSIVNIRVTFFTANNTYISVAATLYEDGTFEAEGAGAVEHIAYGAYAAAKVVNYNDVKDVTCFGSDEFDVK